MRIEIQIDIDDSLRGTLNKIIDELEKMLDVYSDHITNYEMYVDNELTVTKIEDYDKISGLSGFEEFIFPAKVENGKKYTLNGKIEIRDYYYKKKSDLSEPEQKYIEYSRSL